MQVGSGRGGLERPLARWDGSSHGDRSAGTSRVSAGAVASTGAATAKAEPATAWVGRMPITAFAPFHYEDFDVIRTIGEGSFGIAQLAIHRESRIPAVLKQMKLSLASNKDREDAAKEIQVRRPLLAQRRGDQTLLALTTVNVWWIASGTILRSSGAPQHYPLLRQLCPRALNLHRHGVCGSR